jgi:hypothetical protein
MNSETHNNIREIMRQENVWEHAEQMKVYTTNEFIEICKGNISENLVKLLKDNVNRLQKYCDERILEPIKQKMP